MKNLLEEYRTFLAENSSHNTMLSYIGDLTQFINIYGIKTKKALLKTTEDDIGEYVSILKTRGLAYSTISRSVSSLKKFFNYCECNGMIKNSIICDVDLPKSKRKLPNTISGDDVVMLLTSPDTSTLKGIRDKAMLEFMYATGARVSELIKLKTGDLSLKNEMVTLASGTKSRLVPLGKMALDALYIYAKKCRPKLATGESADTFFLNFYGQPLTRQGFWKIVKGYIDKCGIDRNVTAQTLRHSFALHLLKNGADINSVSEMMGHSGAESTKIYLDVMNNKIKEVYKKNHPRA